jgi:hypothetical protein
MVLYAHLFFNFYKKITNHIEITKCYILSAHLFYLNSDSFRKKHEQLRVFCFSVYSNASWEENRLKAIMAGPHPASMEEQRFPAVSKGRLLASGKVNHRVSVNAGYCT